MIGLCVTDRLHASAIAHVTLFVKVQPDEAKQHTMQCRDGHDLESK